MNDKYIPSDIDELIWNFMDDLVIIEQQNEEKYRS